MKTMRSISKSTISKRATKAKKSARDKLAHLVPHLFWFAVVLIFELVLALIIPDNILSDWPALAHWTRFVSRFLTAVDHFDSVARHPEAVRLYLSLTPLFLPVQVWIAYRWLTSDYLGTYRH